MALSYVRVNWEQDPSVVTPINATNLNKMDEEIFDIVTEINSLALGGGVSQDYGGIQVISFGQTGFCRTDRTTNILEADNQTMVARAGTIKSMNGKPTVNSLNGNTVVTLRVNGVDSLLTFTYAASNIDLKTSTNDVAIVVGDLISIEVACAGSTGQLVNLKCAINVEYD